ncbi:MAG: LuxR C-terminal-related transcriptional regulator [Acidimicrobiales bacterium]
MFKESLEALLVSNGHRHVEVHADIELLARRAARYRRALAVLDVAEVDPALEAIAALRAANEDCAVVAIMRELDDGLKRRLLREGANAIVTRASRAKALLLAVERLQRGECVAPDLAAAPPARRRPSPLHSLTERELALLSGLLEGESTQALAARLGVRESTVRTYVQRVLSKLGVHSRSAAVAAAAAAGLRGVAPSQALPS